MRNRFRFHITVLFLLALILIGGLRVKALASTSGSGARKEYSSVLVHSGDTLWSIAEEYCGSSEAREIQEYIKDLKEMNHIENETSLQAGAYVMVYRSVY